MTVRTWRPTPLIRNPTLRWALILGGGVYLAAALGTIDINWTRVAQGGVRAARFLTGFFPPDFVSRGDAILVGLLESIWMTVAATVVGVALAVPLAIGGARNLAPRPVYYVCRAIMAVTRTFPEILVAIFFVKLFGFGTFAGFLTLTFATIGFNAKLLAEDMEAVNPAPLEAVRATGAGWLISLVYAIQPQVMPRFIGLAIYRLDINFRESAVIGIVGAGGIGATLTTAFERYEYSSAAAILLIIIAIVMAAEIASGREPLGEMMGEVVNGTSTTWTRHSPAARAAIWMGWLVGLAISIVCLQRIAAETVWDFVFDAPAQAADIFTRMVPPEWGYTGDLLRPMWDTVTMATVGTLLAVVTGVPLAFLAARNTTPSILLARPAALFIIVASRSINSLIWGLVLVVIVGPGVLAGVLAIGLRSVGFIAKLLYEALEESDPRAAEAITSTGASRLQVVSYGIWPQVLPAFAGISLFRWDINIREATVLGLVGAGGIGLQLNASINALEWSRVSVILMLIFAAVLASEALSARVRKAVT